MCHRILQLCYISSAVALKAPDNFYDDDIEEENLFLDAASVAISESGLENITTVKVTPINASLPVESFESVLHLAYNLGLFDVTTRKSA